MLIRTMLFLQNNGGESPGGNPLISFLPIIIMFVALYLLFILPQQRASKKHKKMLEELRKGDNVLTQAGILGTVTSIKDDIVNLEITPKVEIQILKSSITKKIEDTQDLKENG
ncbi:MAG: preprotein translocase subunit YajC [candidate division WOR-3 bacterium]|nr:preprotein translocase subunit YajC [candidate division WOR-3 bacterium]